MQTIPITNLVVIALPAIMVLLILWRWSNSAGRSAYALARMVLQLCLIGYALTFLFETKSPSLVLLVLTIMVCASSWIALGSVPEQRRNLYFRALLATLVVNSLLLILITQVVLNTSPWFAPNIVIPLAGMVFAVGMNGISLFAERYFAELARTSETNARNIAYKATLIPITNSLLAVGLVSLPGMMTGQILSGVSPLIAVRYQIMIMLMIFTSSGLSSALFYSLLQSKSKKNRD
ncbi:MAG: putative ABC transport system permease protein [Chitinophagales bacterium]|jgi:putative ABC transport system permease protein